MVWAYFAGLITPAVLCLFLVVGLWSFSPNSVSSTRCPVCVVSNIPTHHYELGKSKNITVWLIDAKHELVTSRRLIHRYAWQAYYEEHKINTPVGKRLQEKYGWDWHD